MSSEMMETLISAAIAAPSGDNLQPWRFEVDSHTGRIAIYLDETRDLSPMNCGQRMSRIAVGAALENILATADANGWEAQLEPASFGASAVVRVETTGAGPGHIDAVIRQRATNRHAFDKRPVPDEVVGELTAKTPPLEKVATHWIVDRGRIDEVARLTGRTDAILFGEPSMRSAFISTVDFDKAPEDDVDEGLSLASLELSPLDRIGMRLMPKLPEWLLKIAGVSRAMQKNGQRVVGSASGLCLIVAPDDREETDWLVGRAMNRAWLALTAHGLAAQPMMSGIVVTTALTFGSPELVKSLGKARLLSLRDEMLAHFPECGAGRPAVLLRFGYAPAVSARNGRRPWREVTTEVSLGSTAACECDVSVIPVQP